MSLLKTKFVAANSINKIIEFRKLFITFSKKQFVIAKQLKMLKRFVVVNELKISKQSNVAKTKTTKKITTKNQRSS